MLPTYIPSGPPSPLSENHSLFSRESTEVKSSHLNLCVVPETSVVTSTPLSPIYIPPLVQDYSSTLPNIAALVIKLPSKVVEDISEDIKLLLDDGFNKLVIPPPLEIMFYDSHAFSFKH